MTKKKAHKSADLKSLGQKKTDYGFDYDPSLLESFPNQNPAKPAWTSLVCTEFTTLCPITKQPDFARLFINYIAASKMVESKSLKLYLFSFRNHGDFHEDCVQKICDDLVKLLRPHFIEVIGQFTPRGGIAIWPYCAWASRSQDYQKLKNHRRDHYVPGKYTAPLSQIY